MKQDAVKWLPVNELRACCGNGNYLDASHDMNAGMYLKNSYPVSMADEIVTVIGRSMEPTFYEGDKLLIRHTKMIRPGEIGLFVCNGEGLVKEYRTDGLYPHNRQFAALHPGVHDDLHLIGKVVGTVTPDMQLSLMERYVVENSRTLAS